MGCTSIGYIFLLYQVFNIEGQNILRRKLLLSKAKAPTQAPQRGRNSLPAKYTRSRLIQSFTPSNISDTKSVAESIAKSVASKKLTASYDSTAAATREDGRLFQTRTKIARYKKLPVEWKKIVNGVYYQKAFLSFLGEDRLLPAML